MKTYSISVEIYLETIIFFSEQRQKNVIYYQKVIYSFYKNVDSDKKMANIEMSKKYLYGYLD